MAEKSRSSDLVKATVTLLDAMKGASPEQLQVAKEAYDAILARFDAETEVLYSFLRNQDEPPGAASSP